MRKLGASQLIFVASPDFIVAHALAKTPTDLVYRAIPQLSRTTRTSDVDRARSGERLTNDHVRPDIVDQRVRRFGRG